MSIELITAIGAFLVGIGSVISAILLNRKTVALLEQRMTVVERKLDSHNGYAQRFAETSESIAGIKTDIAVIKTKMEFIAEEARH